MRCYMSSSLLPNVLPNVLPLHVTEAEWLDATQFFKAHPTAIKYRKEDTQAGKQSVIKGSPLAHSFVKINQIIYALNNTKHALFEPDAGKGNFGRAKIGVSQKGHRIVLKIESKDIKDLMVTQSLEEVEAIMRSMKYLLGRTERTVSSKDKGFVQIEGGRRIRAQEKVLTALAYRGDRTLADEMKTHHAAKWPYALICALKAMMQIAELHEKKILHKDIKPENFVLEGYGANLAVNPIDFDISARLASKQDFLLQEIEGTPDFMAPEVVQLGRYSTASDVYALGKMFEKMHLPEALYAPMIVDNVEQRTTLALSMQRAVKALEAFNLDHKQEDSVKAVLQEYADFKHRHSKSLLSRIWSAVVAFFQEGFSFSAARTAFKDNLISIATASEPTIMMPSVAPEALVEPLEELCVKPLPVPLHALPQEKTRVSVAPNKSEKVPEKAPEKQGFRL